MKDDGIPDREDKLLLALVKMVNQFLPCYEDEVDSIAESAGEHAIEALAAYGLMEQVNSRFGRWTEEGKALIARNRLGEPYKGGGGIVLRGLSDRNK